MIKSSPSETTVFFSFNEQLKRLENLVSFAFHQVAEPPDLAGLKRTLMNIAISLHDLRHAKGQPIANPTELPDSLAVFVNGRPIAIGMGKTLRDLAEDVNYAVVVSVYQKVKSLARTAEICGCSRTTVWKHTKNLKK